MNCRQWYYAQIRWAVMVDGKEGLRHWEEAVHIFLSEDREAGFPAGARDRPSGRTYPR